MWSSRSAPARWWRGCRRSCGAPAVQQFGTSSARPAAPLAAVGAPAAGTLAEIVAPSPLRHAPFCKFYGECGGCAVQALDDSAYRDWKRGLLLNALQHLSPVFVHHATVAHILQTLCCSAPASLVRVYYSRALRTLFGKGSPTSAAVVHRGRRRVPNLARAVVAAVHDIIQVHVSDMALAQAAAEFAQRLAALPTVAIGHMKKNLNAAEHGSLAEVLDSEAIHMVRTMMTEDHKAASVAFVEKRAPVFHGR